MPNIFMIQTPKKIIRVTGGAEGNSDREPLLEVNVGSGRDG